MAFGNISTFYIPIFASAGSSLWGSDVRKLLDAPDAGSDATTKTDHGTGTTDVIRTVDPYNTTTTDGVQANYGFAIQPADMGYATTSDSSENSKTLRLAGTVFPTLVATPFSGFGNALNFDGVDRDTNTSGVFCSSTGLMPTAGLTYRCRFRKDRTGVVEVVMGSYGTSIADEYAALYVNASNALVMQWINGGGGLTSISGGSLTTGNHEVEASFDGSVMRLFLNGALLATSGATSLRGTPPGNVPRFWVGRDDDLGAGGPPYGFQGVVDEVEVANVARHTAAYTVSTEPFTSDANSLGLWHFDSIVTAKRFFPAGNHVLTVRYGHNGATGATGTLTMYAYRVGPAAGRTRTLLGSFADSVVLPATSGEVTVTVSLPLSEIVFEVDETIQYSFELSLAGIVVVGRIATFFTGTQTAVATRVLTPGLQVLADTTGTATGSGIATATSGKVLAMVGSAAGSVAADGVGASRADMVGTAAGSSVVDGLVSAVAGATGTASGSGEAIGVLGGIGGMIGTSDGSSMATGVLGATGGMVGSASGSGAATGVLGATGGTTGTATGSGAATAQASSVAGSVGTASGSAAVSGLASIVLGTVGAVEIGAAGSGATVVRKIFAVFDD